MDIKGKRALVTGGTKGIGRAIVEALLAEQAKVLITARNTRDIEKVVAALEKEHKGRILGKACDVGGVSAFDPDVDPGFEVLGAFVDDLDSGSCTKRLCNEMRLQRPWKRFHK